MGLNPILALQTALGVLTIVFIGGWSIEAIMTIRGRRRYAVASPATDAWRSDSVQVAIGASPVSSTRSESAHSPRRPPPFTLRNMVPDRNIPGT